MICFSFVSNQNGIEDIKTKCAEKADSLIRLQFRMEQQVYCQDQIYSVLLQKFREEATLPGRPGQTASLQAPLSNNAASVSSVTEIGVHLNAYFSVSVGGRVNAARHVPPRVPAIHQPCATNVSRVPIMCQPCARRRCLDGSLLAEPGRCCAFNPFLL